MQSETVFAYYIFISCSTDFIEVSANKFHTWERSFKLTHSFLKKYMGTLFPRCAHAEIPDVTTVLEP